MTEGGKNPKCFMQIVRKKEEEKMITESTTWLLLYRRVHRQKAVITYILHIEIQNTLVI